MFFKRKKEPRFDVDDVLIDAFNLPDFDKSRMEGKIPSQISKAAVLLFFASFLLVSLFYGARAFELQVLKGDEYAKISLMNLIEKKIIFAKRGIISDREGRVLAHNGEVLKNTHDFGEIFKRKYEYTPALSHVLGYVKYPDFDKKGNLWRESYKGVGGAEEYFDELLNGVNGVALAEKDASGKILSDSKIKEAKDGRDIKLSIDAELSEALYEFIKKGAQESGFKGGAGVIMNVENGQILALVSYPSYDANVFADNNAALLNELLNDKRKVLLNRATQGLYSPGSIVKPFVALAALEEGVINKKDKIYSSGELKVPNPYAPGKFSIFKDWKAHGNVDVKEAIAYSSNVFFYVVGGGFGDRKGLGIKKLARYARAFGFGEKTGIELPHESKGTVPTPAWKKEYFGEDWLLGNTYHTAIGQFGFSVTPLQAVRYIAAVASYGKLLEPTLLLNSRKRPVLNLKISKKHFDTVHDGMRMSTTVGTAKALNIKGIEIAAKTGTAQVGSKNEFMNSWVVGFWPYKNPKYAFAVVLEKAKAGTMRGAAPAMRPFFEWLLLNKPEYLK